LLQASTPSLLATAYGTNQECRDTAASRQVHSVR
jgi:hypothetical protein